MSDTCFFNADTSEGNFTILNNTCIKDPRLSLKAKGLHTYFMSLPHDWKLYKSELVKHHADGIDSINSAINELTQFGYVEVSEQKRNEDGKFTSKAYGFHAKPSASDGNSRNGFTATAKPSTVQPLTENPLLLNTNKLNTNKQKTKLTNYEQSVSESDFINIIKGLFAGEYLFDNQFESDVLRHLENAEIDLSQLEDYLKYVFERTQLGNPIKSFEGLFRKLALSGSITRDFKLSNQKKVKDDPYKNPYENKIVCPICGTVFEQYEYYCPACSLSVDAIKSKDDQEITIKSKLYQMTEEERSNFEADYQALVAKKGRGFLTTEEQIQFYKDYGILD